MRFISILRDQIDYFDYELRRNSHDTPVDSVQMFAILCKSIREEPFRFGILISNS